ncbi:hypothetical protein Htur_0614 [Haloterrigena turkmenica DSM 5511]|uniref:Cohesin domain-containing protein n=1 Tax=Haloterrigena turkmenica (strain ATCC 51198 / DSM 5511 / JCM 9101 / NCIMB 13204 / VKM B-1734 / 4k) TaxID=543526 RepID=D2RWC3_HALTV|nr:hypothetical protein [Haloterrigena turkmenica]ADB59512.1 hypothetical protein Htur_0614 [Haloterrigena turkmenica DSM 5511]
MRATTERRTVAAGRGLLLGAVLLALLLVPLLGFAAETAAASDRTAAILPSTQTVAADPGEEVTVDVVMQSDGGYGGEGIESVSLVAQYNPEYLEITDVERGPWLEQGAETDVYAERGLAHDSGTAVLEQRRDPPADGATGNARIATLTVAVAEDAPPSEATITFEESRAELLRETPIPVFDTDATVAIDGGGDEAPAFDHPDPDGLETTPVDAEATDAEPGAEPESTRDDDAVAETDDENGGNETEADREDAVPGLPTPVAAGIIVGTVLVGHRLHDATGVRAGADR